MQQDVDEEYLEAEKKYNKYKDIYHLMDDNIKSFVNDFKNKKRPGRVIDMEPIFQRAEIEVALRAANAVAFRKKELLKL